MPLNSVLGISCPRLAWLALPYTINDIIGYMPTFGEKCKICLPGSLVKMSQELRSPSPFSHGHYTLHIFLFIHYTLHMSCFGNSMVAPSVQSQVCRCKQTFMQSRQFSQIMRTTVRQRALYGITVSEPCQNSWSRISAAVS